MLFTGKSLTDSFGMTSKENKMKKLLLFFSPVLLYACSLIEDENNLIFPAGIDSLSVEMIEWRTREFSTHIFCGSMC
jgi:hypothetical protein